MKKINPSYLSGYDECHFFLLSYSVLSSTLHQADNLNMQQDNLAAARRMYADVTFAALALNVGLTDVFRL